MKVFLTLRLFFEMIIGVLRLQKKIEDAELSEEITKVEVEGERKIDEAFKSDDPAKAITNIMRGDSDAE